MRGWIPAQGSYTWGPQAILIGRHATDGHEPRQIRKEAAISDAVCVVDWSQSVQCDEVSKKVRRRVRNHLSRLRIVDFGFRIHPIWDFRFRIADFNKVKYLILYWQINKFYILILEPCALYLAPCAFFLTPETYPYFLLHINLKKLLINPKSEIWNPQSLNPANLNSEDEPLKSIE